MKTFKIFIFSLFLISSFKCKKEDICKALEICDLASNILLPATGLVVGQSLGIVNAVFNVVAESIECTEDAAPSQSDFDIEFRADATQPWQIVPDASNNVIEVNSIGAGSEQKNELSFKFNVPGQYRCLTNADYNLKVPERDESNNNATAGGLVYPGNSKNSNNRYVSEIITVSNPDNIPIDPNVPKVELIYIKNISK